MNPFQSLSTNDVDPEIYITDFTEMIRDIMRAVAAEDATGALSSASRRLRSLFAYADRLPENISWYKVLEQAVEGIKPPYHESFSYQNEYDVLARKSIKYYAEITTSDGFAAARISKARQAMAEEVRLLPQRRELRRADKSELSLDHDR